MSMDCAGLKNESNSRARLTWEVALWGLVGVAALAMRLAQLDVAPLAADEARAATAAWRAATRQGVPLVDYSPVLLAWNSFAFRLFGASDTLARLLPALFGALLAMTPFLLRRSLGRVAMLVAGAYLALSPTALVASRRLEGTTIAAVGAMVFAGGLFRLFRTGRRRWLTLAAVSLALAVSSGASAYGLLVPLGLALLLLSQLWPGDEASGLVADVSQLRSHGPRFLLVFSVALLGFSTGLAWNLGGIGAAGGLLAEWLGRFGVGGSSAAVSPGLLLIVYELLGAAFGLGGLVWGVLEQRQGVVLLGLWAGLGTVLLALMPGRVPTDLLWVVVPLALLTGVGVEAVIGRRWDSGGALWLVYGGIVLVVWAYCYLMLARYAWLGDPADLALAAIALVLQVLLAVSFGAVLGAGLTLRTAAMGTGIALLALTLAAGWGVAYRRPADPREVLISSPTSSGVRDLVQTLEDISWRETGARTTLDFTYEAPEDSVLAWYLRDFAAARRVDWLRDLAADEIGSIAVTTGQDETAVLAAGTEYAGQDFALRRQWAPQELGCRIWESGCNVAFEWFLFRDSVPLPAAEQWATLWRGGDISRSD